MQEILELEARKPSEKTRNYACQVCNRFGLRPVFRCSAVPIDLNVLWTSREDALRCAKGDIELCFCRNCGHISNAAFEPQRIEYDAKYDNSLHFSPQFQQYAAALAEDLVNRYDLHEKMVVEIGCGKGEFLALLCQFGNNRGVGFDPAYVEGRANSAAGRGITFIRELFTGTQSLPACDLVCARHVLEHAPEPGKFLSGIRRALSASPSATVYFEVPNALFTLA